MIAEKGTSLPSDIIMQRAIFYQNDAKGVLELCDELKKAEVEINYEQKGGPIYDVLGDISHDTFMLEKAEQNDSSSKEPLEHILYRLNRIEDAITTSRKCFSERDIPQSKFPKITTIIFNYEKIEQNCNIKILKTLLSKVSEIDSDANIHDVIHDAENKRIMIYILMTGLLAIPEIYQFFYKVLTEYGFRNISPFKEGRIHAMA